MVATSGQGDSDFHQCVKREGPHFYLFFYSVYIVSVTCYVLMK